MLDGNNAWIRVLTDKSGAGTTEVRVEKLATGGFLFHTREAGGEFDCWLETEEEVLASLADYVLAEDESKTADVVVGASDGL